MPDNETRVCNRDVTFLRCDYNSRAFIVLSAIKRNALEWNPSYKKSAEILGTNVLWPKTIINRYVNGTPEFVLVNCRLGHPSDTQKKKSLLFKYIFLETISPRVVLRPFPRPHKTYF